MDGLISLIFEIRIAIQFAVIIGIFHNNRDSLPGALCVIGIDNQKSIYLIPGLQAHIHRQDSRMRSSNVLAVEREFSLCVNGSPPRKSTSTSTLVLDKLTGFISQDITSRLSFHRDPIRTKLTCVNGRKN